MKLRNITFAVTDVLVGVPADQRICRVVVHDDVRPILPPVGTWARKNGVSVCFVFGLCTTHDTALACHHYVIRKHKVCGSHQERAGIY